MTKQLQFLPPLEQPVNQFIGQCSSFLTGKEQNSSDKFVTLLHCNNPQVSGNARNLLCNLAQFPENKVNISFHNDEILK